MELIVNQSAKIPFTSVNLVTGKTSFTTIAMINGVVTSLSGAAYAEIGNGVYTLTFTPTSVGHWTIFVENQIQGRFDVVAKTLYSYLGDIADESLGSWTWDKTTGLLTLLRIDGTTMATFTALDTVQNASRERLT